MPFCVLTGTPGAGKTAVIRQLETAGHRVVEEAATDVIALDHALGRPEPESEDEFTGRILALQRQREELARSAAEAGLVFLDRSVICTLALSRYLGRRDPAWLAAEVERAIAEQRYGRAVFFLRHRGVVVPTAARRISFADSLVFEEVHRDVYTGLGFDVIDVPAGPVPARAAAILAAAGRGMPPGGTAAGSGAGASPAGLADRRG
jgi:predicted ATPase